MACDSTTAATRTTPLLILILILVLLFCTDIKACAGIRVGSGVQAGAEFIRDSCRATEYPALCLRTLAAHAAAVGTSPLLLARAALAASLDCARSASSAVSAMAAGGGMSRGEAAAVRDCVDMLGDAVDELRESAEEMERMKEGGGSNTQEAERFEISNMQTWVSAALTNDDTCVEGFGGDLPSSSSSGGGGGSGSSVSELVRSQVVNVAQLTSNALFFINKLASFKPLV
uniref:Pectinesterase inhibitor domain-containing protein n=1 Tax=Ananas comosus var. bracteatus TaxID=296719 RepID=A0A6V7NJW4_ANACO|nr:unnamed protein product [Ananas comosus var. bracteatus]